MKEIIGKSDAIKGIKTKIRKIAKNDDNVVITGQRGVGKSVVAGNIHYTSIYSDKPLIKLNLISSDEETINQTIRTIIAKERFINPFFSTGGGVKLPKGSTFVFESLESANFITQKFIYDLVRYKKKYKYIFLITDENNSTIDNVRFFEPLAGVLKECEAIHIPPLSERTEDIPHLVNHFIDEASREIGVDNPVIDSNALDVLCRYNWKGNIGQLKTVVQRSVLLSEGNETIYLPEELLDEQTELSRMIKSIEEGISTHIDTSLELIEKKLLLRVLEKFDNHQAMTARFLKISEETLRYRMKKYGIPTAQNK